MINNGSEQISIEVMRKIFTEMFIKHREKQTNRIVQDPRGSRLSEYQCKYKNNTRDS